MCTGPAQYHDIWTLDERVSLSQDIALEAHWTKETCLLKTSIVLETEAQRIYSNVSNLSSLKISFNI